MLIIFPIISDDLYNDDSRSCFTFLATYMGNYRDLGERVDTYTTFWNETIWDTDANYPIVNITIDNVLMYQNISHMNITYRDNEILYANSSDGKISIAYCIVIDTLMTGLLNIVKTFYVCMLLTLAAVYFENDTKELVLEPLEVMIEIVNNVAKDPINAKNTDRIQEGIKNTLSKLSNKKKKRKEIQVEKYEVKIIQNTIVKISALLAIGFGEAGGEIIRENLSSHNDLDPMLKGKKKEAIFGFCDIRGFKRLNEILQEKTMIFINEVADIVHSSVDRFGGAANKNMGDAFLLVWRTKDALNQEINLKQGKNSYKPTMSLTSSTMADMAVLGFLKVIIRINKDKRILAYRNEPGVMTKIPGYKVNMGFGLHRGWAIEGAIGSSFKIDASYLSPNVNIAARLEAATQQFGITFMLSEDIYKQLSDDLKMICRHIDTVLLKGSKIPMELYVIDVNLDLKPSKKNYKLNPSQQRMVYEMKKNEIAANLEDFGSVTQLILSKRRFKELLNTKIPKKFYRLYKKGLKNYLDGNFDKACSIFNRCCILHPSDTPTKVLLEFLKENNYKAPEDWKGYRILQSK
jgi:class 3 adenylate cyclase